MDIIAVQDWIDKSSVDHLVQLPNNPVSAQLEDLEDIGSGVGFVFVLVPMIEKNVLASAAEDIDEPHLELVSYPVMRLGKWYITTNENLSDMIGAMIRIFTSGASSE